jgi:REP element-mobilizing transposase RayT
MSLKTIDIATANDYRRRLMKRRGSNFDPFNERIPRQFGGMLLRGNAKVARPLSTKHAIHLVLKSERAVGGRSLLHDKNVRRVDAIIRGQAKLKGVRLYHFVNVGNHLHMVIRLEPHSAVAGRRAFHSFIRAVSGLIARHVLHAERNHAKGIKFWQARPFTRLVSWGRDYNHVSRYMAKNATQAKARRNLVDWGFGVVDASKIAGLDTG